MPKLSEFAGQKDETFTKLLADAIARALNHEESYAVLAVIPQGLPGEDIRPLLDVAAKCVGELVREHDIAGYLEGEMIVVGLHSGDGTAAQVFSSRLQGDLRLRSFHLRSTNWDTGYAVLGEDAETAEELIDAAIASARNRRRQMASRAPTYANTIPPALGDYGKL
jgi:hypothetical protein